MVARHHNRQPHDHVVLGQLTAELAARGLDWQAIGLDPARVCHALTRLCAAGWLGLVAERPNPTGLLARRLVAHQAGDPAMARHAPGWSAAQQAEDNANPARYLQSHPEAAAPTTSTAWQVAHVDRGEDGDGRGWCPSWVDDDAGYTDQWTDEDEALAVAEAEALWEREQAERVAALAGPAAFPPSDAIAPQARRAAGGKRRWWFHAAWWLVIVLLTIGAYRLVT